MYCLIAWSQQRSNTFTERRFEHRTLDVSSSSIVCPLSNTRGRYSLPGCSVGHHVILAHAHAVKIYREEFKPTQNGVVGITLNGDWAIPYNDSPESECRENSTNAEFRTVILSSDEDVAATQHHLDTAIGWFADPIYLGFYPPYMREMLGDRLPDFTEDEWTLVKHSSDFYGMVSVFQLAGVLCFPEVPAKSSYPLLHLYLQQNTYTTNLCSTYYLNHHAVRP